MHDPTPSGAAGHPPGAAAPGELVDARVFRVLGDDPRAHVETTAGAETLKRVYRSALSARIVDERLEALQAEGWIGFTPRTRGSETAVVAATDALGAGAWLFPSVGELGAFLHRGHPVEALADQLFGNADDPQGGRQMPGHLSSRARRIAAVGAPPGTQLTHATGFAWASRIAGEPSVVGAFFAASEAASHDFHTALNFAGVSRSPVVFLCRSPEAAGGEAGVAGRAVAYGVRGARADGGDALAVLEVVGRAAERAAAGEGPTLVELVLPASDASDGLSRLRAHLLAKGLWSEADEAAEREALTGSLRAALEAASQKPAPALASLFDHVYDRRLPHHREQLEALEAIQER